VTDARPAKGWYDDIRFGPNEKGKVTGMEASALIIARPKPLRDGLQALVGTMPQIGIVSVVSDIHSALRARLDPCPALVLLETPVADDHVWLTVRRARAMWPRARTIILVSNVQQQAEAEAAGADVVLFQGFPAGRLTAAIVKLLPQPVI
jgi:DNA-binding NarL/FixJ family response regulator